MVNADTDSGGDLYAENINHEAVTRFTQISGGGVGDPSPGSGADVIGVARVSEDGSHVYFVARGVLTGVNKEGNAPIAGEPNLYVSVEECPAGGDPCASPVEHTSFIGTLSNLDSSDWSSQDARPVQATPDGRFFVFQSRADLTPDQNAQEEAGQVFEYDAQTETLVRVSRGQEGYNSDGNSKLYAAAIPVQHFGVALPVLRFTSLALSNDGSRVFFSSADALTPLALTGFTNVYEYHDGNVSLISDGHDVATVEGEAVSELIGTDGSGLDVFFTTSDELVPQDRDIWIDVYDARVDGGFAPPEVLAPCVGDACRGAAAASPSLLAPGVASNAVEAAHSPAASPKVVHPPAKKKPKKSKKHKKKTKKKVAHGKTSGRNAIAGRKNA